MPSDRHAIIVAAVPTEMPPRRAPSPDLGSLLRHWRDVRRLSQLDLALEANVSARHLSYVETGRSQPSREMLLHLADALRIPLRERNMLLAAAGYASRYFETDLEAPEMAPMRLAIALILSHQEPYPAFVLDRYWDIRMANRAAAKSGEFLFDGDRMESNMMRLVLQPGRVRTLVVNWEELAGDLIRHLHTQVAAAPSDQRSRALLAEVLAYPGIPDRWRSREIGAATSPLLTTHFRKGDIELRFFSTITTFGTPRDVTLEELHIECNFPADEITATRCRELFGS